MLNYGIVTLSRHMQTKGFYRRCSVYTICTRFQAADFPSIFIHIIREEVALMRDTLCDCFVPGKRVVWTDITDIGMTGNYWDVTRMRCGQCHTLWLRAFLEHEGFSYSGRFYRASSTDAVMDRITPDTALSIIDQAPVKIAGGSRFDGVEHLVNGKGGMLISP